jgi:UDP-glucose 4-epimerase
MRRILVTGAASWLGGQVVQRLEHRAGTEVIATDRTAPSVPFAATSMILSTDPLDLAQVVMDTAPDVVVDLRASADDETDRLPNGGAVGLDTQALAAAVVRTQSVRRVVVQSDTALYGWGPRSPSVIREESETGGERTPYGRMLEDAERCFAEAAAERDLDVMILRLAPIVGSSIANPLSRYLRLPVVPTLLGFDPRLQLLHEADAVRLLEHAAISSGSGTCNVAAQGQLYLSRALRLGGRVAKPLFGRGFDAAMAAMRRAGLVMPRHVQLLVRHGRVTDIGRMGHLLDIESRRDCREAVLALHGRGAAS